MKRSRYAVHGAWVGGLLGGALILVLLRVQGRPEHLAVKAVAIVLIVACFGAFVAMLIEAAGCFRPFLCPMTHGVTRS